MSNSNKLERFDTTLSDLETELTKLKSTSDSYVKLKELSSSYHQILQKFEENNRALEAFSTTQKIKSEELEKSLLSISALNQKNHSELKALNDTLARDLFISVDELRKENRQFYLDFEQVVRIKLDENKSEIKQLIENERIKIKEIIESNINEQTTILVKNQKKINRISITFGIITLILLITLIIIPFVTFIK